MASIEKRSENTYRLTVSCGYGSDGRKKFMRKTINLDSKLSPRQREKELERQKVMFEEEVQRGTYLNGENITLEQYALHWFEDYAKRHLAVSTLPNYEIRLKERIIPALGHLKLSQIQPYHLESFYNHLSEDGTRLDSYYRPRENVLQLLQNVRTSLCDSVIGISAKTFIRIRNCNTTTLEVAQKISNCFNIPLDKAFDVEYKSPSTRLSDKTIKHHHDLISTILSEAERNNLILNNPAKRVRVPKVKKSSVRYYDEHELIEVLNALETAPIKYKTAIYLTIDTGLRLSEIVGLEHSHLDLERGILKVVQQRQRVAKEYGSIIVSDPKTESGIRTITLSSTVTNLLKDYYSYLDYYRELLGDDWTESEFVFRHEDGRTMSPSRPYQWFVEFIENKNLPKLSFHGLRHTNASLLISEETDIVTLSNRLGHRDINVTLGVYSHLIKSREAKAANKMDKFYPQKPKDSEG